MSSINENYGSTANTKVISALLHQDLFGVTIINKEAQFIKANKFFLDLLGIKENELPQKNIKDITHVKLSSSNSC